MAARAASPFGRRLLILDACCLINLFATGRIEEILTALPFRCATSRYVATREVLAVAREPVEGGPLQREVLAPETVERFDHLAVLDLATEQEIFDFVRFAAELDDGEASVCALALARGGAVATDDRKALRVLGREAPPVPAIQTPELLYDWARLSKAPQAEVAEVLRAIKRRARFYPRRDAPRFAWWASFD
jgi:hypothetical protein